MSKKVKTKTNGPLALITLMCAIIAAALLGLSAARVLIGGAIGLVGNIVLPMFFPSVSGGSIWIGQIDVLSIINLASRIILPLISALIMAAAAVLLLVNRKGVLSFIPMGLLTYMAFSYPISLVINLFTNRFGENVLVLLSYLGSIPSYIVSMAIATVFAAVIFVLAATLFKKLRPIPMALISVILGVGFVVRAVLMLLTWISSMPLYEYIFSGYVEKLQAYYVLSSIVSDISGSVTYLMIFAASIFAIVAVITYKKKVAVESAVSSDVIEAVAEETTEPSAE